jgi:hypothetical protein
MNTAQKNALAELDKAICWECVDTRPVFAHLACQHIDKLLTALKEQLSN